MPWWCAMNERTTALDLPARQRATACSRSPRRSRSCPRSPSAASRCRFAHAASGATISASADGVRRDDEVLGQPALEPEPGHAERAVLVVECGVDRVVAGLRDAPRHAALRAVVDLPLHRRRGRSGRAACSRRSASPAAASGTRTSSRSTTAAPARRRRVVSRRPSANQFSCGSCALRDRDEAAEPRLRSEQVVVARVAPVLVDVVADREQVARRVVEEARSPSRANSPACAREALEASRCARARAGALRCAASVGAARAASAAAVPARRRGALSAQQHCDRVAVRAWRRSARSARAQRRRRVDAAQSAASASPLAAQRSQHAAVPARRGAACARLAQRVQIAPQRARRAAASLGAAGRSVSRRPVEQRGVDDRLRRRARAGPARSVSRWPARLPLSTVETYSGAQRLQRLRVVPVVEVAAVALQAAPSCASVVVGALEQLGRPRGSRSRTRPGWPAAPGPMLVGEVRCATTRDRVLLEVVGRQPVVLGADEGLEEAQVGAPAAQEARLRRASSARSRRASGRLSHHAMRRRDEPQQQERRGERQRAGARATSQRERAERERRARSTSTGRTPARSRAASRRRLARRRPFEQPASRDTACATACARSRRG